MLAPVLDTNLDTSPPPCRHSRHAPVTPHTHSMMPLAPWPLLLRLQLLPAGTVRPFLACKHASSRLAIQGHEQHAVPLLCGLLVLPRAVCCASRPKHSPVVPCNRHSQTHAALACMQELMTCTHRCYATGAKGMTRVKAWRLMVPPQEKHMGGGACLVALVSQSRLQSRRRNSDVAAPPARPDTEAHRHTGTQTWHAHGPL